MKNLSLLTCLGLALFACGTEDRDPSADPASDTAGGSLDGSALSGPASSGPAVGGPALDGPSSGAPAANGDRFAASGAAEAAGELAAEQALAEPEAPPGPEPVRWRPCGFIGDRNISCAEVYVPLDHADPEGEQIAISINRIAKSRAYRRRGVLLFNPGGPGVSGKASLLSLLPALDGVAPGYDFIGFDPRGVASSGDRSCAPLQPETQPYGFKEAPVTSEVPFVTRAIAESRRCVDSWGPLLEQLGSNQVVRDMDWIRQALGEPKLNFLGASYGTRLGALYAHYFPESTGAIVLDASVPPTVDHMQKAREVFAEQVRLSEWVLDLCEGGGIQGCPLDARAVFERMVSTASELGRLEDVIGEWNARLAAGSLLGIANQLATVKATPDASWLASYRNSALVPETGFMPLAAINCIDSTTEPPTVEQVEALYAELLALHPAFASLATLNAIMCVAWPMKRDPVPLPSAPSAPPVLVVGGGFDWRTPLAQAEAMAEALGGSARLLVSNHIGHGAFALGSECTRRAIRSFFLEGTLPAAGTVCDANSLPPELAPPGQLQPEYFSGRPELLAP